MKRQWFELAGLAALLLSGAAQAQAPDANALYQTHCAACHSGDRLGAIGPALLPENLGRLRKGEAMKVIAEGRPATQMNGFGKDIDDAGIKALVDLIYTPLPELPKWGMEEIKASRVDIKPVAADKPQHKADPLNFFLVVEGGDHHISILDGDKFEVIKRIETRFALHGGPKFTPDGRYVFWASRDGWVTKFDLWAMAPVAEVRAGVNTRNIAVSSDAKWVMVANYLPHTLVILDAANLEPVKIIEAKDEKNSSRVSAVYNAPPRGSFIAALKDVKEVWEIPYSKDAPYKGWVHSWRDDGPPQVEKPFPVRRIEVSDYLDDFFFDQPYEHLVGTARDSKGAQVVWMRTGKKIADVPLAGMPHLGSGVTWKSGGTTLLATPNIQKGEITIIDTADWSVKKTLATPGPGFFLRSNANSRYVWGDAMMSPAKDSIFVLDKQTLEIAKVLKPAPGQTTAHFEFDRSGKHVLVSVWEMNGAILVYDAETLEVIKKLPMSKPVGKYNVYNKITYEEGTSH